MLGSVLVRRLITTVFVAALVTPYGCARAVGPGLPSPESDATMTVEAGRDTDGAVGGDAGVFCNLAWGIVSSPDARPGVTEPCTPGNVCAPGGQGRWFCCPTRFTAPCGQR